MHSIYALSPLDGRYHHLTEAVRRIFSEYSLIENRIWVEIRWLKWLYNIRNFSLLNKVEISSSESDYLESLTELSVNNINDLKAIEKEIGHDVKAVEYYIRKRIQCAVQNGIINSSINSCLEAIHFCCTSEDINNISYSLMLKSAVEKVFRPLIVRIIKIMGFYAGEYKNDAILALTHGQPATPTTFGKEIAVFASRLMEQLTLLDQIKFKAKFNGAVGNFNAHMATHPNISWEDEVKAFVTSLGLLYQCYSTQIEPHDYISELSHVMIRIHVILIDFVQDIWLYISRGCLKLKLNGPEVGSSTMPHKVNPIDFENAEGNFGLSNCLLNFFAMKLPISRMQRDLSDSTVLRNIGVAFGYSSIAMQSTLQGIQKLELNTTVTQNELMQHWEILGEPIQSILRSNGIPDGYEILKGNTRGLLSMTQESYNLLLDQIIPLIDSNDTKERILSLTPESYIGLAPILAENIALETSLIK